MVEATVDLSVTQDDLNGLLQDNPNLSLQLQNRALTRKCQEQANQIQELLEEIQGLKDQWTRKENRDANGKKGR